MCEAMAPIVDCKPLPPFRLCFLKAEDDVQVEELPMLAASITSSVDTLSTFQCCEAEDTEEAANNVDLVDSEVWMDEGPHDIRFESTPMHFDLDEPPFIGFEEIFDYSTDSCMEDSTDEDSATPFPSSPSASSPSSSSTSASSSSSSGEEEEEEEAPSSLNDLLMRFGKRDRLPHDRLVQLCLDLKGHTLSGVLGLDAVELWKLNCEYGLELQEFLQKETHGQQQHSRKMAGGCGGGRPKRCPTKARRKVCIHTFCLDLLAHARYAKVVEWVDRRRLIFRVLDTRTIAHLWMIVKGNSKEDYETFGRGIRFSMDRGFFTKLRPQRKRVYRLTDKAVRSYKDYRPSCKYFVTSSASRAA